LTNQQLYLAIGIPSFLVILAWVTSFVQNNRTDAKIDALRAEMSAKLDGLRSEMFAKFDALRAEMFHEFKEFYRTLGQHDGQIEALKKEGK